VPFVKARVPFIKGWLCIFPEKQNALQLALTKGTLPLPKGAVPPF